MDNYKVSNYTVCGREVRIVNDKALYEALGDFDYDGVVGEALSESAHSSSVKKNADGTYSYIGHKDFDENGIYCEFDNIEVYDTGGEEFNLDDIDDYELLYSVLEFK